MSNGKQFFTVDKANRALPLVSRIVEDLVLKYQRLRDLQNSWREVEEDTLDEAAESADRLEADLRRHIEELDQVGCELKDLERGLLDFRAQLGRQEIYLCWQRGEPRVGWWHHLAAGFAGRRPVEELPPEVRGAETAEA